MTRAKCVGAISLLLVAFLTPDRTFADPLAAKECKLEAISTVASRCSLCTLQEATVEQNGTGRSDDRWMREWYNGVVKFTIENDDDYVFRFECLWAYGRGEDPSSGFSEEMILDLIE